MRKTGTQIAPVGGHALSNVQLPIYDGVNVMSGCNRHAEGWSGCGDGGHKLKGERFNESVWVFREKRGEGERLLRYGRRTTNHDRFRPFISRSGSLGLIFPLSLLLGTPCHPLVTSLSS